MTGEENLPTLLATMKPQLRDTAYVFCTIENAQYGEYTELSPIASFMETEGLTLIIPQPEADNAGLSYDSAFRCITLTVHSSLDAVGLTAAVANKLADKGISANVIAAYYHDHIFVPSQCAAKAIKALTELIE